MYDLLLKGGEVIDPTAGLHGTRDVAISGGKIAAVEREIPASAAAKVVPVKGRLVTPGLIDAHIHAGAGVRKAAIDPDEYGVYTGVPFLCDGGSAGAANIHALRRFGMEGRKTGMVCFLNVALAGLAVMPEITAASDMDTEMTRQAIEENRDIVRGVKIRAIGGLQASVGLRAAEVARKLAGEVRLPLVVHIGDARDRVAGDTLDEFTRGVVRLMDRGDILAHFMTWEVGGLVLPDGTVYPELGEARRRGVVLDACHGLNHFSFTVARSLIQQGLLPDIITTDLSSISLSTVQSLLVSMSKFLALGLSIDQVVTMTTANAARALGEESRWGSLALGRQADITVLEVVAGDFLFSDANGRGSLRADRLLEPRLVLRNGVEMPCYSRYHVPPIFTQVQH